jgi:hypothetical protein
MLVYGLANTPVLPVKRQTDDELKGFLKQNNLEVPLKIAGEWRW